MCTKKVIVKAYFDLKMSPKFCPVQKFCQIKNVHIVYKFTLVPSEIGGQGPTETGKIFHVLIERASLGYALFKFDCYVEPKKRIS